jgi:hypothetical protein
LIEQFEHVYYNGMDGWEPGLAVRRDWPDGCHELVGFSVESEGVERFVRRDRAYWRRGPVRPASWQVVRVSRRDFSLHEQRPNCRAPDCPTAAEADRARDESLVGGGLIGSLRWALEARRNRAGR